MESTKLFAERQRFKQWWVWLILAGINGLFLYAVITQVIGGESFGTNPMSNTGLLITALFLILFTLFFLNIRLDTEINKEGIAVRFFPFQLKFRHYNWNTIDKCYVRKYSPITEYGGWGIRLGLFGKGRALNVSGNIGLQLEFNDGKKLLIGTNKPKELTEVLNSARRLKE